MGGSIAQPEVTKSEISKDISNNSNVYSEIYNFDNHFNSF
jgi:hypothetical protein